MQTSNVVSLEDRYFGFLSGFMLKCIALSAMIVDHVGAALFPQVLLLRMIGRVAFPIYVFLIAEGCAHTRNMGNYAARLFLFALISEIPFDLALFDPPKIFNGTHQNVFFTLCLGVLAIWAFSWLRGKGGNVVVAALVCVPCAFVAEFLQTDYGAVGVAAIFLCAVLPGRFGKWYKLGIVILMILLLHSPTSRYFYFAMLAVVLIALYNGRRGSRARMIFYVTYPVHLAVIALISALNSVLHFI